MVGVPACARDFITGPKPEGQLFLAELTPGLTLAHVHVSHGTRRVGRSAQAPPAPFGLQGPGDLASADGLSVC